MRPERAKRLAGLLSADRKQPLDSVAEMCKCLVPHDQFTGNTTIGAVFTNAAFSKAELNKIAKYDKKCICEVYQSRWNHGGRRQHLCSFYWLRKG